MKTWRWWVRWESTPIWLAMLVLAWASWNLYSNLRLRARINDARRKGHPVDLRETIPLSCEESRNAALLYAQAIERIEWPEIPVPPESAADRGAREAFNKRYPGLSGGRGRRIPKYGVEWDTEVPADEKRAIEAWVAQGEPILELLREGGGRSECRPDLRYEEGLLAKTPSFLRSDAALNLALCAARLAHERGDGPRAGSCFTTAIRFIRYNTAIPQTIHHAVAAHQARSVLTAVESFISSGGVLLPQALEAAESYPDGYFTRTYSVAILAERALHLQYILSGEVHERVSSEQGRPPVHPWIRSGTRLVTGPWLKSGLANYFEVIDEIQADLDRPPRDQIWARPDPWTALHSRGGTASILAGSLWNGGQFILRNEQVLDLLKIACALGSRDEAGSRRDPETVVQRFHDRFTGGPLRVRRGGGVLQVYSVGKNFTDDGGKEGKGPDRGDDVALTLKFDP